jgi:hypothetical protein
LVAPRLLQVVPGLIGVAEKAGSIDAVKISSKLRVIFFTGPRIDCALIERGWKAGRKK